MKFRKIMLITLLLLAVLTIGAVSATDSLTDEDGGVLNEAPSDDIELSDVGDNAISSSQEDIVGADGATFTALKNRIANASSGSTVTLDNDYSYDDAFGTNPIYVTKPMTIDGKGHTIDAKSKTGVFILSSSVTLENITFINAACKYGGAVSVEASNSVIKSCNFINCTGISTYNDYQSPNDGGAIYNGVGAHGTAITSCSFINCSTYNGGAILNTGENCKITSCDFRGCSVSNHGGAICSDVACSIKSCNFTDCASTYRGGAIFNSATSCNLDSCIFTNCTAPYGNAIHNQKGDTKAKNCVFTDLLESQVGSDVEFTNCRFKDSGDAKITTFDVDFGTYGKTVTVDVETNMAGQLTIEVDSVVSKAVSIYANTLTNFDLGVLDAGGHDITATLDAGGSYEKATDGEYIYIPQKESRVHINVKDYYIYGDNVVVDLSSNADGNATLQIGDDIRFVNMTVGRDYYIDFGVLEKGNYTVIANFTAGKNYIDSHDEASIEVSTLKPEILEIHTIPSDYGIETEIDVKTNLPGNLTFKVDDIEKTFEIGSYVPTTCNLGILDAGEKIVEITFDAGELYGSVTENASVLITPTITSVSITGKNVVYGENVILNVHSNGQGIITVKLADIIKNVTVNKNYPSVNFGIVDAGTYNVVANFTDGKNYLNSSNNKTITVSQAQSEITDLKTGNYAYGDSVVINVETNADGNATVKVGETTKKVSVDANQLTPIDFGILDIGSYDVIVNFTAGKNYLDSSRSAAVKVLSKVDANITVPQVKTGNEKIVVTLSSDATGTVTLTINGSYYLVHVADGTATLSIPELANGKYDFNITYSGDSKYAPFTESGVLNVDKLISTTLAASDVTTVYNGGKYLVVTLNDANGKPINGEKVTVVLNGKTSTPTTQNGQVKVSTDALAPKTSYVATITFDGNDKYAKSGITAKVTVKKATPKLTAKAKTFKKSDKSKKYTVTLKTNQNKVMKNTKVTVKVNKKTYTAKTNSKGVATFKLTKLTKKGKYTAAVKYAGSKYYNSKSVNVKITVK